MPRLILLALAAASSACSDYGFSAGEDELPGVDSAAPPAEPGDSGPGEDACWEPEDGYAANPAARIIALDGETPARVTFVSSDTAYSDDLWLDAPDPVFLVHAAQAAPGAATALGPYAAGSELIFGIDVLDTGDHWQSGPASRNSDGVVHVAVTYEGGCSWLIGFEDLPGGGDFDFNDVVLRVEGMLRQDL